MTRLLRGIGAFGVLTVLLVAVPFALVRFVGRPWPSSVPLFGPIIASIKAGDIGDTTVIKALALLIWIAWIRLALSIVIEIAARLGGLQVPRVFGLGSAQSWAASLVAAAILLFAVSPRGMAAASPSGWRPIPVALLQTDVVSLPPIDPAAGELRSRQVSFDATSSAPDQAAPRAHHVQRNESFWSIADDELGDGTRWREIVEINKGIEVAPGVIFDGVSGQLMPGWTLVIPPSRPAVFPADRSWSGSRTVRVERGDTLSGIAEEELGDAASWPLLWEANRGSDFAGRTFDDPNLILTGWELVLPNALESVIDIPPEVPVAVPAEVPVDVPVAIPVAVPAEVPAAPMVSLAPSPATTPMPTTTAPAPSPDLGPTAESAQDESASLLGGIGAAVMFAAGVSTTLAHRRRRRLRGATIGSRLPDASAVAIAIETELRSVEGGERMARLDIALRAAAAELVIHAPGVTIVAVIVGRDGRIDLFLDGLTPPAIDPWISTTECRWQLPATVRLDRLASVARRSGQPCPALAHIGSTTEAEPIRGDVFLDLESIGLLSIEGDQVRAVDVLRSVAAGIAVSPMSEIAHVITVGLGDVVFGHPSAHEADSLDSALDLAATAIGTTGATASSTSNTFALRASHHGGEAWEPAIVFGSGCTSGEVTDADLVSLTARAGRGLAVVLDRSVEGSVWRLVEGARSWVLQPLGLGLIPVGLTAEDLDRARQVLVEADLPLISSIEPDPDPIEDPSPEASLTDWAEQDWALMVRLLGPVEVVDRDHHAVQFERSKALELVVWLSQHRDRSTRDGARTALWELDVRDATFANVVSDARRALARLVPTKSDEEWIGRTLTEQLPMHSAVITDADLLRDRLAHVRNRSAVDAIAILRPGLELVRDMPFSGTSYLWPDAEGIASQLTLLVTSAAATLGGHYLSIGDIDGVFWATGQGLRVLAGHEELIALRMRAHGDQGDLAGVRREWESYERALHADVWSDGEPAPKLVALRRELLSVTVGAGSAS